VYDGFGLLQGIRLFFLLEIKIAKQLEIDDVIKTPNQRQVIGHQTFVQFYIPSQKVFSCSSFCLLLVY